MTSSRRLISGARRVGALALLLVLGSLLIPVSGALAAVSVSKAELSSGELVVEGSGATANATITVSSSESTATGRADTGGRFKVRASGFRSSTCQATVTDGSTSVVVMLSRCTATSSPPPPSSSNVITPDVAEIGPGYVGADFTTHSSSTTTMTFGPDTLGPVRWEIVAGALPSGLSLVDPNAGFTPAKSIHVSVAGTPTTAQTSTFTIRATDANGLTATRTYTIVINPPLTLAITPQPWAPVKVGEFANLWIEGSGGVRPYRWAHTAGQLPPGMVLIQDNPDGPLVRVGGTPTTAGEFGFSLRLTDVQGAAVSRTFSVTVAPASEPVPQPEPAPAALSSLGLSPASVTGGTASTGTVTLDAAAPSGGASVTLASSNTAAAIAPATVTIAAGSTSATFTISTSAVSSNTTSTISATYAGVTRTASLAVNSPASSADTVSIARAEYDSDKRQLRVEATSSSSGATLQVYVSATNELIGTLSAGRGEFSWPSNPQNVTVKSSLGGSATRTVTLK